MQILDLQRSLAACPMLAGFSHDEVLRIAKAGTLRECTTGEDLLTEGENGDAAFLVLSGKADVLKKGTSTKKEHQLTTVEAGQLLGEIGLLLPHSRSATIRATEALTALELSRDAFTELLADRDPSGTKLLTAIARNIATRSQEINERLVGLIEQPELDAPKRVDLSGLKGRLKGRLSYL